MLIASPPHLSPQFSYCMHHLWPTGISLGNEVIVSVFSGVFFHLHHSANKCSLCSQFLPPILPIPLHPIQKERWSIDGKSYFVIDGLHRTMVITAKAIAILMHRYPYRLAWKFKWDLNFSCTSKWPGLLMSWFRCVSLSTVTRIP